MPISAAPLSLRSLSAFLAVGALCTLVQYGAMGLLVLAGMPAVAASATGFAGSAGLNYALNRRATFGSDRPHRTAMPRFVAVALMGLLLNTLLLTLLTGAGLAVIPAQLLTTTGVIAWNYCIHGAWTFRRR
ncbi:GtrA family protein [[Empedobacter] haloabium]|uniref:GtrA family protein n=1 Tax=[Empedobacter] haloabium TaxID=592317 RepID=A0ABZ1UJP0_9BURK